MTYIFSISGMASLTAQRQGPHSWSKDKSIPTGKNKLGGFKTNLSSGGLTRPHYPEFVLCYFTIWNFCNIRELRTLFYRHGDKLLSLIYQRQTCPRSMNTASGLLFRQTQEDFSKKVEYCAGHTLSADNTLLHPHPLQVVPAGCWVFSVHLCLCVCMFAWLWCHSVTRHQYLLPLVETIELGCVLGNELYKSHYYHEIRTGAGDQSSYREAPIPRRITTLYIGVE